MKTYDEFENALLSGESVCVSDGRGVLFYFYPAHKSDVCGLVTACVETVIVFDNIESSVFKSCSVVTSMEAYYIYNKFLRVA